MRIAVAHSSSARDSLSPRAGRGWGEGALPLPEHCGYSPKLRDIIGQLRLAETPPHPRSLRSLDRSPRAGRGLRVAACRETISLYNATMSNWKDQQVLIVGGGIGGLAAALALARKGIPSQVIEQAAEFKEIGAGIQLGPNVFWMFEA